MINVLDPALGVKTADGFGLEPGSPAYQAFADGSALWGGFFGDGPVTGCQLMTAAAEVSEWAVAYGSFGARTARMHIAVGSPMPHPPCCRALPQMGALEYTKSGVIIHGMAELAGKPGGGVFQREVECFDASLAAAGIKRVSDIFARQNGVAEQDLQSVGERGAVRKCGCIHVLAFSWAYAGVNLPGQVSRAHATELAPMWCSTPTATSTF